MEKLENAFFLSVATRKMYKYKVHNRKCLKIERCKNKTTENKTRLDPQHSPYKFNRHWQFFNRTLRRLFRFQCYWPALQQFSWIKWNRLRVSSQNKLKAQYLKTASSLTMLRKFYWLKKSWTLTFQSPLQSLNLTYSQIRCLDWKTWKALGFPLLTVSFGLFDKFSGKRLNLWCWLTSSPSWKGS